MKSNEFSIPRKYARGLNFLMAPTFNIIIIIIIITTITIILFTYTVQDQGKEAASKNLVLIQQMRIGNQIRQNLKITT